MRIATQPVNLPAEARKNGLPGATIILAAKEAAGDGYVEQPRLVMGEEAVEVGIASDNPNNGVVVLVGNSEADLSPIIVEDRYYKVVAVGDQQWQNVERKTMMTCVGYGYDAEYVIKSVRDYAAAIEGVFQH